MAFATLSAAIAGVVVTFILIQYVIAYLQSPLKKLPGPFLAKFSNIWRFLNHYKQIHIETQRELHAQYGDVVRIGPTTVSIADPNLVKTIYSTRGTFLKAGYPSCFCNHAS